MDIQPGQTWSVPPHGPEMHVHDVTPADPEPIVGYSLGGQNQSTHQKSLSVFQAFVRRMSARLVA